MYIYLKSFLCEFAVYIGEYLLGCEVYVPGLVCSCPDASDEKTLVNPHDLDPRTEKTSKHILFRFLDKFMSRKTYTPIFFSNRKNCFHVANSRSIGISKR